MKRKREDITSNGEQPFKRRKLNSSCDFADAVTDFFMALPEKDQITKNIIEELMKSNSAVRAQIEKRFNQGLDFFFYAPGSLKLLRISEAYRKLAQGAYSEVLGKNKGKTHPPAMKKHIRSKKNQNPKTRKLDVANAIVIVLEKESKKNSFTKEEKKLAKDAIVALTEKNSALRAKIAKQFYNGVARFCNIPEDPLTKKVFAVYERVVGVNGACSEAFLKVQDRVKHSRKAAYMKSKERRSQKKNGSSLKDVVHLPPLKKSVFVQEGLPPLKEVPAKKSTKTRKSGVVKAIVIALEKECKDNSFTKEEKKLAKDAIVALTEKKSALRAKILKRFHNGVARFRKIPEDPITKKVFAIYEKVVRVGACSEAFLKVENRVRRARKIARIKSKKSHPKKKNGSPSQKDVNLPPLKDILEKESTLLLREPSLSNNPFCFFTKTHIDKKETAESQENMAIQPPPSASK